jgi:3-(methylthio)propanoyl-CoA dehydrogenase
MTEYMAPLREMEFVLREVAPLSVLKDLPGGGDLEIDLALAILEEAGRFASGVLSPLNATGDRAGARWTDGGVQMPDGWGSAWRQFSEAGWMGLSCREAHGGQGLPRVISCLAEEMWNGANVSFALCAMLTRGAVEAIELRGSSEQKALWLPKLVGGEWTGTMNLTEPQAGSDLSTIRTRAEPQSNGSFLIRGQKIFITYGDHDLADNIVHLVLARIPGAPEGIQGISLFLVPKYVLDADGNLAARNDVRCVSIEHKLGIHASPTAVMAFGDKDGALGWLIGEENKGLETMFIMMNAARFSVGLEGVGLAERATQRAVAYARQRVQGIEAGSASREKVAIARHPDVKRMLGVMRARTEALRAVAAVVALAMDVAERHPDSEKRDAQEAFVDLMIPVVKGWSTESAVEIASLGVQVHGGVGFIEETGAAQHLRDARITPIYEGTTGIQAVDLAGRKLTRDGGAAAGAVILRMHATREALHARRHAGDLELAELGQALLEGIDALETATTYMLNEHDVRLKAAGATSYLELFGTLAGAWQMGEAALAARRRLAAGDGDPTFLAAKIASARVYFSQVLPKAAALCTLVVRGGASVLALDEAHF